MEGVTLKLKWWWLKLWLDGGNRLIRDYTLISMYGRIEGKRAEN